MKPASRPTNGTELDLLRSRIKSFTVRVKYIAGILVFSESTEIIYAADN